MGRMYSDEHDDHAANRGAPADTGRIERRLDFTAHAHFVHAQLNAQALDIGQCMT